MTFLMTTKSGKELETQNSIIKFRGDMPQNAWVVVAGLEKRCLQFCTYLLYICWCKMVFDLLLWLL